MGTPSVPGTDIERFRVLLEHYCTFNRGQRGALVSRAETCLFDLDFDATRARRAVEAGRLAIDPAALARCLVSEDVPSFAEPLLEGPCAGVWVPRGKPDDPCDSQLTCPADHYCERSVWGRSRPHYVGGACGVCRPRKMLGTTCVLTGWTDLDLQCAVGLRCDDEKCAETPLPCESNEDCAKGAHCSSLGCVPRGTLAEGENCGSAYDCGEGRCVVVGECSEESCPRRCAPAVPDGQKCSYSSDCGETSYCGASLLSPASDQAGTPPVWSWACTPVAEGTPCSADYSCGRKLLCVSTSDESICVKPVGEGEPCLSTEQCLGSLWCLEGRCLGRVERGGACLANVQCPLPYDCVDGRCRGYAPVGSSCDGSDADRRTKCEYGSDCVEGLCRAWSEYGEPCTGGCVRGLCLEGVCRTPPSGTMGYNQPGIDVCGDLTVGGRGACVEEIPDGRSCADEGGWWACGFGSFCSDAQLCTPICVL